jgi:hypothetical protein
MNDDNFVTLFGSPANPESAADELEAARTQGYLKLRGVKSVSTDDAQAEDEHQQQAILLAVIASLSI